MAGQIRIGGLWLIIALVGASASVLVPPSISLSLSEQLGQKLHRTETDHNGVPCRSVGAVQATCGQHAEHVQYYASCNVDTDDEESCPEPTATANDHHEGELPVTQTTRLYIESKKGRGQPQLVDRVVDSVSYHQRGEYTLTYDAKDSSGNEAETVVFHFFLVDHAAPDIHILRLPSVQASQRFYKLRPPVAIDGYDGSVQETLQTRVTDPGGRPHIYGNGADVLIDTDSPGAYHVEWFAHDYAGAFGLGYRNNARLSRAIVTVREERRIEMSAITTQVTAKKNLGTPSPTPSPTPPTPSPTPQRVDCAVSNWGEWDECSSACGPGVQARTRAVEEQPQWGGEGCPPTKEVRDCARRPCPIDCVHEWLPWMPCSDTCGGGTQLRHIQIVQAAAHGGQACPEAMLRTCNNDPCPTAAPTPAPTHKLAIPPMLILHYGGEVVARSSAFGTHQSEDRYRAHLQSRGYAPEEIDNHVAAIAEREQRIQTLLGQNGKWWMNRRRLRQ